MNRPLRFTQGLVDALPIFFGYLSVGFAFGIKASQDGHPAWSPVLMSATHISGTGQFAVVDILHSGGDFAAALVAVVALNLRYVLMALAVAQRLPASMGLAPRLLVAMADTDEIVGVAVRQRSPLNFPYMMGLLLSSYAGWLLGTAVGVAPMLRSLLPPTLVNSLGIALYAMFLAIILPEARRTRPILLCVALAAAASVVLRLLPTGLGAGWITLASGIASAVVAAMLFPKRSAAAHPDATGGEDGEVRA